MAREKKSSGFWGIWSFLKWLIGLAVVLAIFCMTFGMINLNRSKESC